MVKMPEDYQNGVQGMIDDGPLDEYEPLRPLADRRTTSEIKIKSGGTDNEAEMIRKFHISIPIIQLFRVTQKLYGFVQNSNVKTDLEASALDGAISLNDFLLDAPCLNREGRWQYEESRAQEWLKRVESTDEAHRLLKRWSQAAAFMLRARVVEEQEGIDAAVPLYPKFIKMKKRRKKVYMKAAKLPPAENMYFRCRVRQYEIMNERQYDLDMGYPTADVTDLKRKLAEGANVHDLVPEMPWPWRVAYNLCTRSMSDGEALRTLLMAMQSQQLPQQTPPNWGPPPGYWPPYQNGQNPDSDEPPDQRRPIFGFLSGNKPNKDQNEPKQVRRRSRGKR